MGCGSTATPQLRTSPTGREAFRDTQPEKPGTGFSRETFYELAENTVSKHLGSGSDAHVLVRAHTHTHTRVPCGTGLLCLVSSSSRGSWLGPQGMSSEREGSVVLEPAPSRQGAGGRLGAGPRSRRGPQCCPACEHGPEHTCVSTREGETPQGSQAGASSLQGCWPRRAEPAPFMKTHRSAKDSVIISNTPKRGRLNQERCREEPCNFSPWQSAPGDTVRSQTASGVMGS